MPSLTDLRLAAAAALLLLPLASQAQATEPVLARSSNLQVDAADIRGEALRLPAEHRAQALSEPNAVRQLANNLMLRRVMAAEAEAAGLGNDPAVQAALRIARERVLSDALVARWDAAAKPSPVVAEQLAEVAYKGNPARFARPAETRARHILILSQTDNAKQKAEEVLKKLKEGADFEELARSQSQDPGSAAKGGDLGFFPKGRMVPEFEAAVDALQKPGELSGLVQSQFGWHVIRLEERRSAGTYAYDEVKDTLKSEAEAKAIQDARQAKVQQLQQAVKLETEAIESFSAAQKPSVIRR